ncbi:MAG: hypothetical protein KAJ14_07510, partial [Candidatus Omnitrophica bacterium]|nr:hypothetical protein [Candidatus Omnitrophota bacterium]
DNMKNYLLEEVYELIDGINKKNSDEVKEELGDVFLNLIVISLMFDEKSKFTLSDVLANTNNKLISRHPHVFSSKKLKTKDDVLKYWIKSKAEKKKRISIKDRLPLGAPSLLLANIFYKECYHTEHNNKIKDNDGIISNIVDKIKKIKTKKGKELFLTDIMLNISELAFEQNIDLESSVRDGILHKAEKVSYDKNKS